MEISARLLMYARHFEDLHAPQNVTEAMREGADEITRLRAENARLREVLEEYACTCEAGTCAAKEGFRDWPCGGPARDASTPPPAKETEA